MLCPRSVMALAEYAEFVSLSTLVWTPFSPRITQQRHRPQQPFPPLRCPWQQWHHLAMRLLYPRQARHRLVGMLMSVLGIGLKRGSTSTCLRCFLPTPAIWRKSPWQRESGSCKTTAASFCLPRVKSSQEEAG